MAFDAENFDQVKLRIIRAAEVANSPEVQDMLRAVADEVQQTARNMAPEDYGDLKDAIQVSRQGDGRDELGRFMKGGGSTWSVYINNNHPVRDPEQKKSAETVGQYAWHVHEHMGWGANDTGFMPSQKSVAISAAAGEIAGGKFLERALEKHSSSIYQRVARVVLKQIETLDY